MTSSTEVNSVISIIGKYNLTQYDSMSEYYPVYTGKSESIIDGLKEVGEADTSFANRKKIATANSIKCYTGTAAQNTKMLTMIKEGKLLRA